LILCNGINELLPNPGLLEEVVLKDVLAFVQTLEMRLLMISIIKI